MKVRAIKLFQDKKEGVIREKDDTFIISKERCKEINSTRFGKLVEVIDKTEEVEETKEVDFNKMIKKEIVEFAKEKDIDLNMNMTKKEMVEILQK